jgi:hypothetical protein
MLAEALRATGTDPDPEVPREARRQAPPVCTGFVQTNDTGRENLRLLEGEKGDKGRLLRFKRCIPRSWLILIDGLHNSKSL